MRASYEEEELPKALRYFWDQFEARELNPPIVQKGAELLRSLSAAFDRGIPHHLFVIGQELGQFVAMDLTRPGAFGDCPIMTWPAGQELASSLGDWLLARLKKRGSGSNGYSTSPAT